MLAGSAVANDGEPPACHRGRSKGGMDVPKKTKSKKKERKDAKKRAAKKETCSCDGTKQPAEAPEEGAQEKVGMEEIKEIKVINEEI